MGSTIIRRGCFGILTILLALILQVQDGRCAEVSDDFKKDIETLLKITGTENIGTQMGSAISNQIVDSFSKQNPEIPQKAVEIIKDEINIIFKEAMPGLVADFVPLYAKYFTHNEIKSLIAFYRSPLGVKSIKLMPELMSEGMRMGQAWGQNLTATLKSRIESRLKKEGFSNL